MAPERVPRPRSPTGGDVVGDVLTVGVPGGRLEVALGDTIRLGGPVVHVFDVDVDLSRLRS